MKFQKYRISCLVQLLRMRFHKMLHITFQFLYYNFCLIYAVDPLPVYTPPPPPPVFLPV